MEENTLLNTAPLNLFTARLLGAFAFISVLCFTAPVGTTGTAQAQSSLYSDVTAHRVGDIITIILQENISGSSQSDSRNASNSAGSAGGSASGNFLPFEPTFGSDVQVNYGADQQAQSSQGQLLEGNMSVQIAEVTPQGDFIVEGSRTTEINGELHQMSLLGRVRSRDINRYNQVFSYHVANANISYRKKGGTRELTKQRGFIKRVIFTGIGLGLGAAIIMRGMD